MNNLRMLHCWYNTGFIVVHFPDVPNSLKGVHQIKFFHPCPEKSKLYIYTCSMSVCPWILFLEKWLLFCLSWYQSILQKPTLCIQMHSHLPSAIPANAKLVLAQSHNCILCRRWSWIWFDEWLIRLLFLQKSLLMQHNEDLTQILGSNHG